MKVNDEITFFYHKSEIINYTLVFHGIVWKTHNLKLHKFTSQFDSIPNI